MPFIYIEQTDTAMRKRKKIIGLIGLFLMGAFFANAQASNPNWIVSKDVQRVANKAAFSNEERDRSHFRAASVDFPSIVISKGVFRKESVASRGNIESKGTPAWVISKGVHRIGKK